MAQFRVGNARLAAPWSGTGGDLTALAAASTVFSALVPAGRG